MFWGAETKWRARDCRYLIGCLPQSPVKSPSTVADPKAVKVKNTHTLAAISVRLPAEAAFVMVSTAFPALDSPSFDARVKAVRSK